MARLKTAVLISGRGSNMTALVAACAKPAFPAEIVLVLSNNPRAEGLATASAAGIATQVVDHHQFADRESFEAAVDSALEAGATEFICLAGFMRILTEGFVNRWRDRIINIHPSLLPAFKGLNTHERVVHAGVCFSGCTVHFARPEMDQGPVIVQAAVAVHQGDSADDLAARVLAAEHRAYPLALRLIAEDRVRVIDEQVMIDGAAPPEASILNPVEEA